MKYLAHEAFRLAATYLAIMMVMSIIFSTILYSISSQEVGRRPRNLAGDMRMGGSSLQQFFEDRESQIRQTLLVNLLLANLTILIIGALVSYLLAERTLRPIEHNMATQTQFISDASHELRTPLTSLLVANEVALRNKKLTLRDARTVIKDNVTDVVRLQSLADSLLGLLQDVRQPHEPVDLQQVMREAIRLGAVSAAKAQVKVIDETSPVVVNGSHTALTQLCTILLDNAIKYSQKGGRVILSIQPQDKHAHLIVKDEGIGMDDATKKQIFLRFFRGDSSRSTTGYGLGLSIAQKIVIHHRGKIAVESAPYAGSTFIVSLPKYYPAN